MGGFTRYWLRNPPPGPFLQKVVEDQARFAVVRALLTPLVKIQDVSVEPGEGPGEWTVTATVANEGYLDTSMEQARRAGVAKADRVTIGAGDGRHDGRSSHGGLPLHAGHPGVGLREPLPGLVDGRGPRREAASPSCSNRKRAGRIGGRWCWGVETFRDSCMLPMTQEESRARGGGVWKEVLLDVSHADPAGLPPGTEKDRVHEEEHGGLGVGAVVGVLGKGHDLAAPNRLMNQERFVGQLGT